jgi:integrase
MKPKDVIGAKAVRPRVVNDSEWRAFWRASEGIKYPYGPLFRMLALTGQRRSEAAEAQWSEFDLKRKLWTIPAERMKAEAPHVVPLTDSVITILESLPRFNKGEHLFSTDFGVKPVNGFSKAKVILDKAILTELRKDNPKAKLAPFVIHDIRRSMRTGLSALPVSSDVAELVIAHARPGLRKVYDQHAFEAEKRHALELWVSRLRDIVEPPPANVRPLLPKRQPIAT